MNFITKCNELNDLEFKSPDWIAKYTELVKEIYAFDKLYVVINPKMIDYDYEVGMPFVSKLEIYGEECATTLIFSDRIHADAWNNKHSNGRNFIGVLRKSEFNDFFAKSTLFKIKMCALNEGKDGFMFGNADMVTINNIPTQITVNVPKELRNKKNLTLRELNPQFNPLPLDGPICANEIITKLQLVEHVDTKVNVLTKNDTDFVNNKVHIFLGASAVSQWMARHKDVANEYVLKEETVGEAVMNAILSDNSKGLVVDGLAPFSLFADQIELKKIKSAILTYTLFNQKKAGKIDSNELKSKLADAQFYVCIDENEECGYDSMIRESDESTFKAIQLYTSEESANKINIAGHEVVLKKLSEILENAQGYGLILEPYSHAWVEVEP